MGIRDVDNARISEVSRPTEVTELDPRSVGDLAPGQYSDRRRHWETPIPKQPFGVGAEKLQTDKVQYSEIGSSHKSYSGTGNVGPETEAHSSHSEDRPKLSEHLIRNSRKVTSMQV